MILHARSTQQMILLRQKKCHYFLFYLYFNGFDIRAALRGRTMRINLDAADLFVNQFFSLSSVYGSAAPIVPLLSNDGHCAIN